MEEIKKPIKIPIQIAERFCSIVGENVVLRGPYRSENGPKMMCLSSYLCEYCGECGNLKIPGMGKRPCDIHGEEEE